jgi:hypothetical protein
MTTKKRAAQPSAAKTPAARPMTAFERQAPPAPRLQAAGREPQAHDPAGEAAPGAAQDGAPAPRARTARDVILRLVETLKEL